jgi:hypothetical protein
MREHNGVNAQVRLEGLHCGFSKRMATVNTKALAAAMD